jgi:poly(3-hydroxybutyrate) depolymerase
MNVGGVARRYLRFIPNGYQPSVPYALVFGYHGSGGTADKARAMMGLEAEAAGKAIFVYPQGVPDPAFAGDNRWDPTKGSDDYTFLDGMIAEISASHCIDRDRVFVAGFSNGARMTSMIGCYRGDVVRAIAPVAPGGNSNTLPLASGSCVGEVGIWEGLGTEDPDHLEGATLVRDFYRTRNGCSATRSPSTPAACQTYDGCRAAVPSVWCSYPGPHAWPSIGAAGVWGFFATFK